MRKKRSTLLTAGDVPVDGPHWLLSSYEDVTLGRRGRWQQTLCPVVANKDASSSKNLFAPKKLMAAGEMSWLLERCRGRLQQNTVHEVAPLIAGSSNHQLATVAIAAPRVPRPSPLQLFSVAALPLLLSSTSYSPWSPLATSSVHGSS